MANLKDIKRKIKSVQSTQKTTRAMKLVSTSKLRKAEEMAKRSKYFANKINEVMSEIRFKVEKYRIGGVESKYFSYEDREVKMVDIVFVTADKGLCGGFNMTTIKNVRKLMEEYKRRNIKVRLRAIGKKGISYFRFNDIELIDSVEGLSSSPDYKRAAEFIKKATDDYLNGLSDEIVIVHNGFKNMISQQLSVKDLLPIDVTSCNLGTSLSLMEIEPEEDDSVVLDELAQKYIEYSIYYSLIDSLAAEHSARMQAMDNATKNAKELARSLTIKYNKARQEAITTELVEINTGVESMK